MFIKTQLKAGFFIALLRQERFKTLHDLRRYTHL